MSRWENLEAFVAFMLEGVSHVLSHPNIDDQLRQELTEASDGLKHVCEKLRLSIGCLEGIVTNDIDRLLWGLAASSFAIGSKGTVPPGAIKFYQQEVQPRAAARASSEGKIQRQTIATKYRHLPVGQALPLINGDLAKLGMAAINAKTLYRYRSVDK